MIKILENWVQEIAQKEHVSPQYLRSDFKKGRAVIIGSIRIKGDAFVGIGKARSTKVNVNLGTSSVHCFIEEELEKAWIALKYDADTISDCSMQDNLDEIRQTIFQGNEAKQHPRFLNGLAKN